MHYLSNELQRQSTQLNDLSETFFIVRKPEGMAGEEAHFALSNSPSLKSEGLHFVSDVLQPLWVTASSPVFHGANSLLNFETTTSTGSAEEATAEVDYDGSFLQPAGKKRRLTAHQVQLLERSFEEDNKLEPERKVQLAKELGLLPRQVAIWFQNRRARCKTKHMEKEYGALRANYDILKAGYHKLVTETEKLKQEVMCFKERLQIREERTELVQAVDSGDDHKQVPSSEKLSSNVLPSQQCQITSECNQDEAASSARSDVLDSDSPYFTEADYLTWVEPANSSHVFEPEYSDFSQEEGEDIYLLPIKQASSMDQNFWCWPY